MSKFLSTVEMALEISAREGVRVDAQHIRRAIARGHVPTPQRVGGWTQVFLETDVERVTEGLRAAGYLPLEVV
jgi:hypothetical protein